MILLLISSYCKGVLLGLQSLAYAADCVCIVYSSTPDHSLTLNPKRKP